MHGRLWQRVSPAPASGDIPEHWLKPRFLPYVLRCSRHDVGVTLSDVIRDLDRLDDDDTIYAEAPAGSARAVVAREPDDGTLPQEAIGLHYFLEVDVAKDAIRVWSEWRGVTPSADEKLAAVIYYAVNDAFLPTD
jgi:hypothetical protein